MKSNLLNGDRTNNACEVWNNAFASLVGHQHPSIWVLLDAMQMDEAMAVTDIQAEARAQPPAKRVKRATAQHQRRLQQLCADRRDGRKTVAEMLQALGHAIRLTV